MSETTARLDAALEGRYRIERELGQGGMANVYLAEDVRHRRNVALKVLKPELAAVVGADRFLAEIETTANLQHPHILPLYDSGEADGFLFYVMPYVEGESLREKLDRERQLPVDDALRIAKAVSAGLDYAHRQGVVHRDIKPANILLQDGEPVIADFGIALAIQQAGGGRLTETGLSLGTPYYMSPEQATAERDPGPRSDVYSLGCVLYEMLTGDPPFQGSTAQAVLGRILTGQPTPPSELRKTIPPHVEATILRSLQKVPADRFESAAEFVRGLDGAAGVAGYGPTVGRSVHEARSPAWLPTWLPRWIPWAVAALAIAVAAVVSWRAGGEDAAPAGLRATLELPADAGISAPRLAISDNGRLVVASAFWDGRPMLVGRRLDEFDFFAIEGTENAALHFLSPDGRSVAFRVVGEMRRVPVAGGSPVVMDDEGAWGGGDWLEDGRIIYSRSYRSGLWLLRPDAREPEAVTEPMEGELAHWWPQLLPDGEHVLFTAFRTPISEAKLAVVSLESGERRDVLRGGVHGRYVPATGHVLFARGEALYAVPFDPATLETIGDPVPVVNDVAMDHTSGLASYAIAENGTLVYVPASDLNVPLELVWMDRDGAEEPLSLDPGRYANPALSPDGRRLAVALAAGGESSDLWVVDLVRGTRSSITTGGGSDFGPLWSRDGRLLFYSSEQPVFDLYQRPADASSPATATVSSEYDKYAAGLTPDGDTLLYVRAGESNFELWKVSVSGGESAPHFAPDFTVLTAAISPDGSWISYLSLESGRPQIYLSPYREPNSLRRQVSVADGTAPRWTRGGRELVFRSGNRIMAVAVDPETGEMGRPEALFEGTFAIPAIDNTYNYDVTPDGERFLMIKHPPERAPRRIVVVTNFFEELRTLEDGGNP